MNLSPTSDPGLGPCLGAKALELAQLPDVSPGQVGNTWGGLAQAQQPKKAGPSDSEPCFAVSRVQSCHSLGPNYPLGQLLVLLAAGHGAQVRALAPAPPTPGRGKTTQGDAGCAAAWRPQACSWCPTESRTGLQDGHTSGVCQYLNDLHVWDEEEEGRGWWAQTPAPGVNGQLASAPVLHGG